MAFVAPARQPLGAKDFAGAGCFEPLDAGELARAAGCSSARLGRAIGESRG
jgi:hypothetical protein